MYTESEVLDFIEEEDVKFIRLAFFDLHGKQKNVSIMPGELMRAFRDGVSFDASSVFGFQSPEKSDLFLHPDPATIAILPWRPSSGKVVRMFCDIRYPDGTAYEKDFRYKLQQSVKKAKDEFGLEFNFGTEIEFYLCKLDEFGQATQIPLDNGGYMDIAPDDKGENIRREICFTLEQMGITPEASHHEVGPGQNEIDFKYANPLSTADNTSTFKWIVKTKAAAAGLYADFRPKPFADEAGSGMHINISCRPLDEKDTRDYIPNIIAGLLKHLPEITLFLNSTENSYRRLGSCKAPKFISWGHENRSLLIRLPASKQSQRLEIRSPDPETNPYLAFALIIEAALDGVKNNLVPPAEVKENLFDIKTTESTNLSVLPRTLEEALDIALNSDFVKTFITPEIIKNYCVGDNFVYRNY